MRLWFNDGGWLKIIVLIDFFVTKTIGGEMHERTRIDTNKGGRGGGIFTTECTDYTEGKKRGRDRDLKAPFQLSRSGDLLDRGSQGGRAGLRSPRTSRAARRTFLGGA